MVLSIQSIVFSVSGFSDGAFPMVLDWLDLLLRVEGIYQSFSEIPISRLLNSYVNNEKNEKNHT